MKLRCKVIWRPSESQARSFRCGGLLHVATYKSAAGNVRTLWIGAKACLQIGGAIAVLGWLAAAGGLYHWLSQDPFNQVKFSDLALPWRWSEIRTLRGRGYVAAGLQALEAGRTAQGIFDVQRGLSRAPDDAAARLTVARTFAKARYYAGVRQIMLPQLDFAPTAVFVRFLIESALENDDHATVIAVCNRALPNARSATERNRLLVFKAGAQLALGEATAALATLDTAEREASREWRRVRVEALAGAGRGADAVTEIRAWPAAGVTEEFRSQMLALAYLRAGQFPEMTATLQKMRQLWPLELGPRLTAIAYDSAAGLTDAAWEEMSDALRYFDGDLNAVRRLRTAGMEAKAPELVALCVENARELGRPLALPLFDLALTQLRAGRVESAQLTFEQALRESARLQETLPAGTVSPFDIPGPMRDWMRTLLDAVTHPTDQRAEAHSSVLEQRRFPLAMYSGSLDVLAAAKCWNAAESVARSAAARFPGSTEIARRRSGITKEIAALPVAAPMIREKRKLPAPTVEPAGPRLSATALAAAQQATKRVVDRDHAQISQAEFSSELDGLIAEKSWESADRLIARVRTAHPAWLMPIEGDLAWRQVQYALTSGDLTRGAMLMSQRLKERKMEAVRGLTIAREYREAGNLESARLLAAKLAEAVPEFRPGRTFAAEINPPETTSP